MEVKEKPCKHCWQMKSIQDFAIHFKMKDGHKNICHECIRKADEKNHPIGSRRVDRSTKYG